MSLHMIGKAHLDPVWLWQWPEGYSEITAPFLSALDRLVEHPGFIFTCACAAEYEWVEQNAPELFERVRARIREGRWHVVGGMWIQPDMNVPQGNPLPAICCAASAIFGKNSALPSAPATTWTPLATTPCCPRFF